MATESDSDRQLLPGPTTHYLLPYERRAAERMLDKVLTRRAPYALRFEYNYGPEGIRPVAAARANWARSQISFYIAVIGLVVSDLANTTVGYFISAVVALPGIALLPLWLLRSMQTARVGRAHRGGQPYWRFRAPSPPGGSHGSAAH